MTNFKEILVTTTSTIEGIEIKKYLKPVSAHIVAGTNAFSDLFASFSDVFGGRSQTYQKQLANLYTEAIEKIKNNAFEIGANCIVGLSIDLDEISGKGKSMFMLTAVGTAVIVDISNIKTSDRSQYTKVENISIGTIRNLKKRREIIEDIKNESLNLEEDTWEFITSNQVYEVYDFVILKFQKTIAAENEFPENYNKFYKNLIGYIDALPDVTKNELLYKTIATTENMQLLNKIYKIINDILLLNLDEVENILSISNYQIQKRGTFLLNCEKEYYNREDITQLEKIYGIIKNKFPEKGSRSFKKSLLSAKEKEVWTCECGKTNDIESYCSSCKKDIFGFTINELSPDKALAKITEKISLIKSCLE